MIAALAMQRELRNSEKIPMKNLSEVVRFGARWCD